MKSVGVDESLASLAVRDDGRFVAIGTMFSGSVSIYIAFSLQVNYNNLTNYLATFSYSCISNCSLFLQRVLHIPSAHSMFVTGLEFLPQNNSDGPPISSTSEAAVLSISVDNKVCIHSLPYRRMYPI